MIVSFTGAQSTGKSTLLDALVKANEGDDSIVFVPEVTRILKREYNIPINEEASVMTQYQITCDHYKNAFKIEPPHVKLKVLDRCALDGTVYCDYFSHWKQWGAGRELSNARGLDSNNDFTTEWEMVSRASRRYLPDMFAKYDIVFYTDPKDVPLIDDGERSASVEFRNAIIGRFENYIRDPHYKDKIITLSGTVEERLSRVQEEIKKRNNSIEIKIRN
jgi:nicotinamide riboside kinase